MSYSPSGGYPVYTWEWECTFSAFNFQRLLNGRPAVVYPEVTVYYLKDGATQFSPENCNGKTVYQYDIYEAMQNDTAFFVSIVYFHVIYKATVTELSAPLREKGCLIQYHRIAIFLSFGRQPLFTGQYRCLEFLPVAVLVI